MSEKARDRSGDFWKAAGFVVAALVAVELFTTDIGE